MAAAIAGLFLVLQPAEQGGESTHGQSRAAVPVALPPVGTYRATVEAAWTAG